MPPRLTLVSPDAAPREDVGAIPQQLRSIALDVECGQLIGAQSACVIVKGGTSLMVYGIGPGHEVERLNAAYMLLSRALRELETVARDADA